MSLTGTFFTHLKDFSGKSFDLTDVFQKFTIEINIPYTAKLSRGKTFAVVDKTHYSPENFRGASGPCHYVPYTANDSRGKLSRLANKPRKPRRFSPSKVLPYTVYM